MRRLAPLLLLFVPLLLSGAMRYPKLDGVQVAVTIDDVPWTGGTAPEGRAAATKALLAHLDGVPTTAFVVCDQAEDGAALKPWVDAGVELANHTADHGDLQKLDAKVWLKSARSCHDDLTRWGHPPRFFRYPYLRTGGALDKRDWVHNVLRYDLKQTIARVTVDNHEWKLAQLYTQALNTRQPKQAEAIAADYPKHMMEVLLHAAAVSEHKVGRVVPQVLLLHANALNAHYLGTVLDRMRQAGVEFIPLEQALADPVYAQPDGYVGPGGISWLYRIEPVTPPKQWTFENSEWERIKATFGPKPPQ